MLFFCFSVYQDCIKNHTITLDYSKDRVLFYKFASEKLANKNFISSLDNYCGEDLIIFGTYQKGNSTLTGGSKRTLAYKESIHFLKENNLI